ncbi:hypothetical protein TNCV_1652001 [Trichonephila clavipes]|nr:hypothetical protein TNCV_1652001 [Trichonephila clavipes]
MVDDIDALKSCYTSVTFAGAACFGGKDKNNKIFHQVAPYLSVSVTGKNKSFSTRDCFNIAGLSTGRLGRAPRGRDKLNFARFSAYKFRSSSAKRACRSSAPRARNELKSALRFKAVVPNPQATDRYQSVNQLVPGCTRGGN